MPRTANRPSLTHEDASAQPSGGMPDTDPRSEGTPAPVGDADTAGARARVTARLLDETATTRIGRFTILSHLGRGGMGVVWAAYDPSLDRRVALKVLHSRRDSAALRERIVREAKAMAKLNHPNVAQVFEVGEDRGATYVAMEYIRGQTLRQWQGAAPRTTAEVLEVYLQAAAGLAAAHAVGLIHRDFKPDNAMVGDVVEGVHGGARVRVLDFGLARAERGADPAGNLPHDGEQAAAALSAASAVLTPDGAVVGTPSYMAPEQLLGEHVDARADQFSFCVALWEALVGERPFPSSPGSALLAASTTGDLRPLPKNVKVPPRILAALRRGLAPDPTQRFADLEALSAALADNPVRRPGRLIVGAAVVLLVGSAGAWQLDRQRRAQACADEAAGIATTWGDDSRDATAAALRGTGLVHATMTASRVEQALDEWTSRWSTVRSETCLATSVEHTRDDDYGARATSCLGERRESLAALVGVLSEADQAVGHAAASAALSLPDPRKCGDADYLRRFPALAEATPGGAAALRQRLAASEGLNIIARPAAALEISQEVTVAAHAAGLLEVEALAHLRSADALSQMAQYPEAQEELEVALGLAMQTRDDVVTLTVMIRLVTVLGDRGEIDEAMWYGELAMAILGRVDDADHLHEAAVLTAIAVAGLDRLNFAHDLALLERALAITEQELGREHPRTGTSLTNLGSVLQAKGDLTAAAAVYLRALTIAEQTFGPDHPKVAMSLNNYASTVALLGDRELARASYGRSLSIWERAYGPDHPELTTALDNLAFVHYQDGDYAGATPLVERSLAILRRVHGDQPTVAHSTVNLARLYLATGDFDRAQELLDDAIRMLTASLGADHFSTASAVATLGEVARGRKDHRGAAQQFERALALYLSGGTDQRWLAETRFDLATSLWAVGNERDRALGLAREAVRGYRGADGAEPALLASFEQWVAEHGGASGPAG